MPKYAPTKKQMEAFIISIFINARPVKLIGSALCARKSAMMDMNWSIVVMIDATVGVEEEEEKAPARH